MLSEQTMSNERLPIADYLVFFSLVGSPIFGKRYGGLFQPFIASSGQCPFLCSSYLCFDCAYSGFAFQLTRRLSLFTDEISILRVNLATPQICATVSAVRLPPIVIYSLQTFQTVICDFYKNSSCSVVHTILPPWTASIFRSDFLVRIFFFT